MVKKDKRVNHIELVRAASFPLTEPCFLGSGGLSRGWNVAFKRFPSPFNSSILVKPCFLGSGELGKGVEFCV